MVIEPAAGGRPRPAVEWYDATLTMPIVLPLIMTLPSLSVDDDPVRM